MILSLVIAGITFVPIIGIVGISPQGGSIIGGAETMTSAANTTFWTTYNAFGLSSIILIIAPCTIAFAVLIAVLRKIEG